MKKVYLKMFLILFLGSIGISAYAQGTWKTSATGTEGTILPSTEITMGIPGLSCMHSDAANVIWKSDVSSTSTVTYNGVTWDNQSMVQGATNGMYYAFRPTSYGILDIPVKMGAKKATFVLELTDALQYSNVLADLTTAYPTGDLIIADPTYFTTPLVYDTYHKTSRTWSGASTDTMQSTAGNVYLVMSFPVNANKTYVVGVFGSKLMLRGANYTINTSVKEPTAIKGISFNGKQVMNENGQKIELYNMSGRLITRSSSSISTDNLPKGVYVVRTTGSNGVLKFYK